VFDQALYDVTKRVTRNLKVIDRNYYPVKEAENSNLRAPIGLGGKDSADAFIMLRLPLQVTKLKAESRNFETLYFAATASMELQN
jgi:ribonucleoside-diphosphate reductase alpha chain